LEDGILTDWYITNRVALDAMTFDEYMKDFRANWLDSDWAAQVRKKLLSSTQGTRPFPEWAAELQSTNALLTGESSYFSKTLMRNQLEANMNDDLSADCRHEGVHEEVDLKKWMEKVKRLDEKRLRTVARQKEAIDAALSSRNRQPFAPRTNLPKPNQPSEHTAKTSTRVPPLSDTERQLLNKHEGCFKCRRFYVSCRSKDCKNGFPDGATYKPLTENMALNSKNKSTKTAKVASVEAVAAVMMPSAVLGNGTDSGEEYVRIPSSSHVHSSSTSSPPLTITPSLSPINDPPVAPLTTPQLKWQCLLDGPLSPSSVSVSALIDDGSSLVLIDEALVTKLGLRRRKLHKPISTTVAMNTDSNAPPFFLHHYVKIKPSSLNGDWTSRTVKAVIAPQLCASLLLGGPFLAHNRVVIDHELRTCIAKESLYDLLNPPVPSIPISSPGHFQSLLCG
ncbi:hypothetical protein C8R48DRAFT_587911, partial [Suillus tomentosus]